MNHLAFAQHRLDVQYISDLVSSPSCGAVSLFLGTTRDNFDGKKVVELEYEAYEPMAMKALEKICNDMRNTWPTIEHIAVYHRLGSVPVKEISVAIAVSSPHRADAISATQFCVDNLKKSVPIWKKEKYVEETAVWKENKESRYPSKCKKFEPVVAQDIKIPFVPSHLIQVKASNEEIERRIEKFIERKRQEINDSNIRDFCIKKTDPNNSCARIDAVLIKRRDSKGHLQVNRVLNTYHRDQSNSTYMTKFLPKNGIEERLENLEIQLSLERPVDKNIYERIKELEDRMLYLESFSLEYVQFWDKASPNAKKRRKKVFSLEEIDEFIAVLERKVEPK